MSAAATTKNQDFASANAAPHALRAGKLWLHEQAQSIVGQLAATLAGQRRSRHARAAFRDAYRALHRLDERVLMDIGIRPEQVTAYARSATTWPRRADAATRREG